MSKLIILEGPDCAGKTTLSKNLTRYVREELKQPAVALRTTCSKALLPGMLDYQTALFRDIHGILGAGYHVILDRSWPSEHVYAPVFRSSAESFLTKVKMMAEQFSPSYVFIERDDIEQAHAEKRDKAHPYNKRQFARVVRGYKQLAQEMHGDFFLGPRTWTITYEEATTNYQTLAKLVLGVPL